MALLLLLLSASLAIVPAVAALVAGVGVPPQQGYLFAVSELGLATVCGGIAFQNRYNIWLMSTARLSKGLIAAGGLAAACLIAYLFVYNLCVIEHPLFDSKLLFPLSASGKLRVMIERAGSRYAAVEMYGLAAVFDAISEAPVGYALALGTLLALCAPAVAVSASVAFVLALRYPSALFRPSTAPEKAFDVFLCYNRADKIAVRSVAKGLADRRIRFFIDENENPPGQVWTDQVGSALSRAPAFAIFFGGAGVGKWQSVEIQNISEARLEHDRHVIPVFLPDAPPSMKLPMQLAGLTWVDFRKSDPDPMTELVRGIRTTMP